MPTYKVTVIYRRDFSASVEVEAADVDTAARQVEALVEAGQAEGEPVGSPYDAEAKSAKEIFAKSNQVNATTRRVRYGRFK